MKRIIALLLSIVMLLTGCGQAQPQTVATIEKSSAPETTGSEEKAILLEDIEPQYDSLDDERLLAHIEDLVYQDAVTSLNSEEYFVENVSAVYISKEYLEELEFNSQSNIFFGYTLAELNEIFQGTKYIFTLSDTGTTTVQELQQIEDAETETMLKNVAIGTGVILVCVTVSVASAGLGAPAVSMIFLASAKTAATFAASSAAFGGISAGIVRGVQTGDFDEAAEAAAMGATEGFKWGAIGGAITGGGKEAFLLKSATKNGLTMKEAARIQAEARFPIEVISELHSMEEYEIYKKAGLKTMMVNGRTALVQKIDLNYKSLRPDEIEETNLERMLRGLAPLDPETGKAYELHHIGQKNDGVLATLTSKQHRGKGNFPILHNIWKNSEVNNDSPEWRKTVSDFWKYLGNYYAQGGV